MHVMSMTYEKLKTHYAILTIHFCIRTYVQKIRIFNAFKINSLFGQLSYFTLITNIAHVGFKLNCRTH